jgi:hypothetical protein
VKHRIIGLDHYADTVAKLNIAIGHMEAFAAGKRDVRRRNQARADAERFRQLLRDLGEKVYE